MMHIVTHTPVWIFILFVFLLVFGFLQTRTRNVKLLLAYFLPIGMTILSFAGVISSFGLELVPIFLWSVGVFIVSVLGYKLFPLKGIVYNTESKSYSIPGSWFSFGVIMAIFFTKYTVAVMKAINISLVNNSFFVFYCVWYMGRLVVFSYREPCV